MNNSENSASIRQKILTTESLIPVGVIITFISGLIGGFLYLRGVEIEYNQKIMQAEKERVQIMGQLKAIDMTLKEFRLTHREIKAQHSEFVTKETYRQDIGDFRSMIGEMRADIKVLLQRQHQHAIYDSKKGE